MSRKTAIILLMVALTCWLPAVTASAQDNIDNQILFYTNKYRKSKGKPALSLSDAISREARQHSRNMAKGKTSFGHDGFEDRIEHVKEKSGFVQAAAENVAFGQLSAKEVVDGWIKSPPHRKNLLGDYNLTGIGTATKRDGTIYFTQVFIRKK